MIMTRQDDKRRRKNYVYRYIYIYLYACLNIFSISTHVIKNSQVIRYFFFVLCVFIHHHPILPSCVTTSLHYYIETNTDIHTKCHQHRKRERKKNILESYKVIKHK